MDPCSGFFVLLGGLVLVLVKLFPAKGDHDPDD
jgi:hypothetical protein